MGCVWSLQMFGGCLEGGRALELLGKELGGKRTSKLMVSLLESEVGGAGGIRVGKRGVYLFHA